MIVSHLNRNLVALTHDTLMAGASFLLALYIRLGDYMFTLPLNYLVASGLLFTLVSFGVFFSTKLYRGSWRYASMRDLITIVKVVSLIIPIFALLMFLFTRLEAVPRSVLFINWMALLCLLGGSRFAYRMLCERSGFMPAPAKAKIPVLLIGAGDSAEQFIRELARSSQALYEVVAITDDDAKKKDRTIHGVPIYGETAILETILRKLDRKGKKPQKLIVTEDPIAGDKLRDLLERADRLGIPLARLPRLSEFKSGDENALSIRPIAVEDLLGRAQNVLDRASMRALISGKRVMVTGAGGTIGGELTRQVASYKPARLIIVELSEYHLYQIEREIRAHFPELPLEVILCDVRDRRHVEHVFARERPEMVFHAAAIKHVPIAEFNIAETVLTNVVGTRHIAEACLAHGTSAMVMISTDKAVNPTNVMGATKRLAESFCQALGGEGPTRFITVRFGNVLGSTGSVVPLFQEQLAQGGPLTVTHPDMTRYFMTVREAVELVLQSAVLGVAMEGRRESIFVLDMGEPVKILDLATQLIRLAGLRPGEDIEIVFTGLRPGEKLYEELFHGAETLEKTTHGSIFLASPRSADIGALRSALELLAQSALQRDASAVLAQLKQLVPEFNHSL